MIASGPATAAPARPTGAGAFFCGAGLHKRFGGVQAVRDISLTVPRGGVFAIIGPNGAGKSTLLNLMSGLYQPDAGRMIFDGVDLVGLPAHKRVRLGLGRTFQKIRLLSSYPCSVMSSPPFIFITISRPGNTSSTAPPSSATKLAVVRRRSSFSIS